MAEPLPALPQQFRSLQHHLRTAQEHEKRDPVVSYYCRLYAMQTGMKIDSKTPECRKFLLKLMDQLETNFQHRKYARWKATYIHNCLKSGVTPQAGPIGMEGEDYEEGDQEEDPSLSNQELHNQPSTYQPGSTPNTNNTAIQIPPGAHAPANTPAEVPHNAGVTSNAITHPSLQNVPAVDPSLYNVKAHGDVRLTPEDFTRAQKFCKYAGSALQYEDVNTAVQNLQKALKLLTTGRE
ncbi:hypothetical protein GDO86_009383 [Hymenochirus boettgeri]|uniref:Vesicle trafficking 1 n=1 Tax=Hymenochirus boettgeri TaxID=247094 RepID=A0A8T2JKC6_9PIPI|nr:hypothetical protein GDO86_009383 [Hymenochirus boettgeri]